MKTQVLFAFLGGVVVGGIAALLLAPDSGEETRKKIAKILQEEQDRIKDAIDSVKDKAEDKIAQVKRTIKPCEE